MSVFRDNQVTHSTLKGFWMAVLNEEWGAGEVEEDAADYRWVGRFVVCSVVVRCVIMYVVLCHRCVVYIKCN